MAKSKGPLKVKGFIGGVSYYEMNGNSYAKASSGHTKERQQTDPAFAKVRKINVEFGGASKAGKAVRDGLGDLLKIINDNCNNQLTSLFQKVIAVTEGQKGTRPVKFLEKRDMLQNFRLGKKPRRTLILDTSADFKDDMIELSWGITISNLRSYLPKKSRNTHARFFVAAIQLSELAYDKTINLYCPRNTDWHGKSQIFYSDYLTVSEKEIELGGKNQWQSVAPIEGDGVMICKGLIFYQKNGSNFQPMIVGSRIHIHDVIEVGGTCLQPKPLKELSENTKLPQCHIEQVPHGVVTLRKIHYKRT
jgi:hypothetical protein